MTRDVYSTAEVAQKMGLGFNEAKARLQASGVQPALIVPMGKRPPSVYWNKREVQPVIDATILERIQKRQGAAPAPAAPPVVQPAPATDGQAQDFIAGEIAFLRTQADAIAAGQAVVGTDLAVIKQRLTDLDAVMRQILDAITSPEPK